MNTVKLFTLALTLLFTNVYASFATIEIDASIDIISQELISKTKKDEIKNQLLIEEIKIVKINKDLKELKIDAKDEIIRNGDGIKANIIKTGLDAKVIAKENIIAISKEVLEIRKEINIESKNIIACETNIEKEFSKIVISPLYTLSLEKEINKKIAV